MDADKVTEKLEMELLAFAFLIVLCCASGVTVGLALNSPLLGVGVLCGLAAIIIAIFLSQDKL
jgi:hypothetical protein